MFFKSASVLTALLVAFFPRESAGFYEHIAEYLPQSLVTDFNALDLDQQSIRETLSDKNFPAAKALFERGAHSGSYAVLNLDTPLAIPVNDGSYVVGTSYATDGMARGNVRGNYAKGDTQLEVVYAVSDNQEHWVGCRVGALTEISSAVKDGCFASPGNITGHQQTVSTGYTYSIHQDNMNSQSMWRLSSSAGRFMLDCDDICPVPLFKVFHNFYGVSDYGNVWIEAAFNKAATTFPLRGNVNFGGLSDHSRAAAISRATVVLNVWMTVAYLLEKASRKCNDGCSDCNTAHVHLWDTAVAYYTGSLEGEDGSGPGVMLYGLADEKCKNFNTCGEDASTTDGTSKVNHDLIALFRSGQLHLANGQCSEVRRMKLAIEHLMAVPLIQGLLEHAYRRAKEPDHTESEMAEGAVYAAAVVPLVARCSSTGADFIHENMKIGSSTPPDFDEIKHILEKAHGCMGIRGQDVGGFYNHAEQKYHEGAAPKTSSGGSNAGLAVGLTIAALAVLGVGFFVYRRRRRSAAAAPAVSEPPAEASEGLFLT